MFFEVNSGNRHAVRKILTAAGMPSSDARSLPNGKLGQALYDFVQSSKIPMDQAVTACKATLVYEDAKDALLAAAKEQADDKPVSVVAATAPSADHRLKLLQELLAPQTPQITEAQVRAMVDKELSNLKHRPMVIEIKTDGITTGKLDGKLTHEVFAHVVKIVSTRVGGRRLHVWLTGPSGSGKSYIGKQASEALGLKYYPQGAVQSKYDLIGYKSPSGDPTTLQTPLRMAVENGGVFAFDDCDASDARAFAAFNELLANGRYAFPDRVVEAHADFVCIATANTWGTGATADYVGRNKIDAATLSRFVRLEMPYDEKLEADMVGSDSAEWCKFVQATRKAVVKEGIKVLITPRHTLQGAALLKAGLAKKDVQAMTVFAGLDEPTVKRLKAAVSWE